jgi:transcriptional regulator with XRE-family HTH domain
VVDLSRAIAERRKRLGLNQADVARRAGLTTSQISRIESGAAAPKLDSLEALARALDAALVLVPLDRLTEVRRVVGGVPAVADPGAGSAFEDVFIPDPEDQNG